MLKIIEIDTIAPELRVKLSGCGLETLTDLTALHTSPRRVLEVAQETGLSIEEIHTMVSSTIFYRIEGISPSQSLLLVKMGIDTIEKLASAEMEEVAENFDAYNHVESVLDALPAPAEIDVWIRSAKAVTGVCVAR